MSRPGRSERHGRTLHIHAWHRSALQCPFGVRACVCVCVCVCVFVQDVAYAAAGVCAMGWVKVSVSVYHGIVGQCHGWPSTERTDVVRARVSVARAC